MRLVSYRREGEIGLGVMVDDQRFVALPKAAPDLPQTMRGLLELGEAGLDRARSAAAGRDGDYRLDAVALDPVVTNPQAIWCVGLNYKAHREETGREETEQPTMFLRIAASQVGHQQAMVLPRVSTMFDYEGELAVVIGRGGRHIAPDDAHHHVAGYACYNDGSIRDWQRHTSQFGPGKNFARTGGFGPWLTSADEFGDPYAQTLITRLNGEEVQRTSIDLMIFKIETLIAYLSTLYSLLPGDVIVTGTPGGVGFRRNPPLFMKAGDKVTVEISGIGTLVNPIVAEG